MQRRDRIDGSPRDEACADIIRRREHYFSFDLAAYRAWSVQATRSGWTMSPMVPMVPGGLTTFTLLHLVYTRIRGKV